MPSVGDLDLVVQCGRIQEPYRVLLVLVVFIGKAGIERGMVHAHIRARVMGKDRRLVEGHHVGPRLAGARCEGPIIAVGPEDHHGLGGIKNSKALGHMGLIPILSGNRPGITGQPVLVIGHEHQTVGGLLQLSEGPFRIVHRCGDPHFTAQGTQGSDRLGDKAGIGPQTRAR